MTGHIRRRGKRSWQIFLELPRTSEGKRRQKTVTVRGTKRQAEAELARLTNEIATGAFVEPTKMTVSAFLDRWLSDYAAIKVSAKTFERYREIVRCHLAVALGQLRLMDVRPLHIQEYYASALRAGRLDGKGGLSAQTVLHHHRVLREALQQAIRWQLLARNPADAVEPPRPQRRESAVLSDDQTARLIASADGSRLWIVIVLAATLGLRRGELLALRWQDIDFDNSVVRVRRSLEQIRGGLRFKEPKSARGRRAVALPGFALEALRRHRLNQRKERLLFGASYRDQDLVCARPHGTPMDPGEVTAGFAALVRTVEIPRIRLHDLRHGHATQLLRQGIHPKVVSERLGHSTTAITLDLYSHVAPDMQDEAARSIDRALRDAIARDRSKR